MLQCFGLTRTVFTLLTAVALLSCVAPLQAQSSAAPVVYQVGQVSIMDAGFLKPVSVGSSINQKQLIVTGPDGFAKCQVLSDGSTFEVYPNSKVVFRETPGDWKHLLNVFIGRVKVFIQHAPGVANPNNVTSPTAVISVRGTVFDVQVQDDDGTTFVTVDEGEVGVRNLTAPGDAAILRPGDSITVIRGQRLVAKQIDKGNILRNVLRVARDTVYQGGIQRRAGTPSPTGGGTTAPPSSGQGDQGKPGTGTSTGTGTPAPPAGTVPAPPGAVPPPPGGDD
jgi:hypothetical protein